MPREKLVRVFESNLLDGVLLPPCTVAEVDRIVNIGDRVKDILLAKLGDDYSIDDADDEYFSWEIRYADISGVVGGYFYYSPTQTWTRIDCRPCDNLGKLIAPVEIRELVKIEVNQQLRAINGLPNQEAIA